MTPRNTQFGRDEIVEAAFRLVREQGWSGFSAQAVAKAIGGSTMPIYSHFANVRELEDAVCRKAFDLLRVHTLRERTGDRWIDLGAGYVRFALEERHLFRCLWDGRNPELQKKLLMELWEFSSEALAGYPLFEGLSEATRKLIRSSRGTLTHGLAFFVNTDSSFLEERGMSIEEYVRTTSMALYEGFRLQTGLASQEEDKWAKTSGIKGA